MYVMTIALSLNHMRNTGRYLIKIMMSHERHYDSDHRPLECCFYQQCIGMIKLTPKARITGPFVKGIHRCPVQNWPYYNDVIMGAMPS